MKYKDIRKFTKIRPISQEAFFIYFFGRRLSPFIANVFLNLKIEPNTITVYMIITGIIGAILFAFNNIWLKFTGYIFMMLWVILDCADGEVARITKVFSKFGKELDYIAHIINHPLFCISFLISLIQLNKYSAISLSMISILLISSNLIRRNLLSIGIIYNLKGNLKNRILNKQKLVRIIIKYFINFLTQYPNFVLIFPLLYFIDISMNVSLSFIYFIIITISSLFFTIISAIKIIFKLAKE